MHFDALTSEHISSAISRSLLNLSKPQEVIRNKVDSINVSRIGVIILLLIGLRREILPLTSLTCPGQIRRGTVSELLQTFVLHVDAVPYNLDTNLINK